MAGVNLLKELERHKKTAGGAGDAASSGGGGRFSFLSSGGSRIDLTSAEKGKLAILALALVIHFVGGAQLQSYIKRVTDGKNAEIAQLDSQIAAEKSKLARLSQIQEEIKRFEAQMADIQRKLQVVETVQYNRNAALRMVDLVISEMPETMWLRKVDLNIEGGVGPTSKLALDGSATSNQVISSYMKRMETSAFFSNWQLQGTQRQTATANSGTREPPLSNSFTLTATVERL